VARVLVTGAHGRTGRAVLSALAAVGHQPRALIRDPAQAAAVAGFGAAESVVGDLSDASSLVVAATGMDAVVHIGPPMHPDEVSMTRSVIDAAARTGVGHLVYYSVMHPLRQEVRHHRLKLAAEQQVVESELPFTILQPARYMQHVTPQWQRIRDEGVLGFPFDVRRRFSVVDLDDLASVVALVSAEPRYHFGTFELAGPEPLSTEEMAQQCAELLGRPVRAEQVPADRMAAAAAAAGAGPDRIEQMRVMNDHYDRYGFAGNPLVLGWILGREPARFGDYLRRLLG
jgi:uncharacterized protein YbjT (DUF2867 family)